MKRSELEAAALAALVAAWGAGLDAAPWEVHVRAHFARAAARKKHGRGLTVDELARAWEREDTRTVRPSREAYRALAARVLAAL